MDALLVRVAILLGTTGLIALVGVAGATSVRPMTTQAVFEASTRTVVARCVDVETRPVPAYGGQIFTFSTFETVDRVAGTIGDRFTLRLFGGHRDGVDVDAPMMPRFAPGDEVLLMLGKDNPDGHPIVLLQGVLRIEKDEKTGTRVVTTPVSGLDIRKAADGTRYATPPSPVPLEDLVFTLRELGRKTARPRTP